MIVHVLIKSSRSPDTFRKQGDTQGDRERTATAFPRNDKARKLRANLDEEQIKDQRRSDSFLKWRVK